MSYRNGQQGMVSYLQPINVKLCFSLHLNTKVRDPHNHDRRHSCQQNSLVCGGIRTSSLRSTSVRWRPSARRPSISPYWLHTWSGEGTETHYWCCTEPLFVPSYIMGVLCMAEHPIPVLRQLDCIHNTGIRLTRSSSGTIPKTEEILWRISELQMSGISLFISVGCRKSCRPSIRRMTFHTGVLVSLNSTTTWPV